MLANNWKNAEYNRRMGKKNTMATMILNRWRSAGFEDGTRTKRGPRGYAMRRHDISCGRRKSVLRNVCDEVLDILPWFGRHWHREHWPEAGKGRPCWLTPWVGNLVEGRFAQIYGEINKRRQFGLEADFIFSAPEWTGISSYHSSPASPLARKELREGSGLFQRECKLRPQKILVD